MSVKKILVATASPDEQLFIRGALENEGHEVLLADTGKDALAIAIEKLPDLVLMDVVLPGLNGFQTTRKLTSNENTQTIPVVLMDKELNETNKKWGFKQGATDYVEKCKSKEELLELVFQMSFVSKVDGENSAPSTESTISLIDEGDLKFVEQQLAQYIGPLAAVLVEKASKDACDLSELCQRLAGSLPNDADREKFLKSVNS